MRHFIKDALLKMLEESPSINVVKSGATCVAAIALLELPDNSWPELLQKMIDLS